MSESVLVWRTCSSSGDVVSMSIEGFKLEMKASGESDLLSDLAIKHMSLDHCFEAHSAGFQTRFCYTISL